ncbi:MAG: hypothetical protein H0X24_12030 [Ktedonobacterales bacterium]|nr:hypothetical protein [Ktedonobacterales bacterium]
MMHPPCSLHITAETLSAWQAQLVAPAEQQRLAQHIPDCPACRHTLARFTRIAQALQTPIPLPSQATIWRGVRQAINTDSARGSHSMPMNKRAIIIGAMASAAVVVTLFAIIIVFLPDAHGPPTALLPSATATLPATVGTTPLPTHPAPTTTPTLAQPGCPTDAGIPSTQIGDILVFMPRLSPITHPGILLTGSHTGKQVAQVEQGNSPKFGNALPQIPDDDRGYYVTLCNTGRTSHILNSVGLQITSFSAMPSPLNIWVGCDVAFNARTRAAGSLGCGGSAGGTDMLHLTWPNSSDVGTSSISAIPAVNLAPNTSYTISIGVDPLPHAGAYTFAAAMTIDQQLPQNPSYATAAPSAVLITGSVAQLWSGQACLNSPTWQSQIPTTTTDQYYVCPEPA